MKAHCKAIVLRRIDYGDTGWIITCFTREKGEKAFLYKGGKKKKNQSVILPMRIVEIDYYQHHEEALATIVAIQVSLPLQSLYNNSVKTSILFFVDDFLNQLIRKLQFTENQLFDELERELIWLNSTDEVTNYPLFWMIKWIEKMGIKPIADEGEYFDIENATFEKFQPISTLFFYGEEMEKLSQMFCLEPLLILSFQLTKQERKKILSALIDYCRFHLEGFHELKSIGIIQSVYQ